MNGAARAKLPVVFFMSTGIVGEVARQLRDDGLAANSLNDNEGAESTLAFFQALLPLQQARKLLTDRFRHALRRPPLAFSLCSRPVVPSCRRG